MSDRKLSDADLEALAHGRRDLASEDARCAIEEDETLAERVAREREHSRDASVALKRTAPDLPDLDAMIARAMKKLPAPAAHITTWSERSVVAGTAPSPAALALGGVLGAGIAVVSGLLSVLATSGPRAFANQVWGDLAEIARLAVTLAVALDRVAARLPGGWATVALAGLVLVGALLVLLRAIAGPLRARDSLRSAATIVVILFASGGTARAWEIEGEWPHPDPLVSVDVDRVPLSEALRRALAPARIGLVYTLADEPRVTLHVREAPLREVFDALLADVPARVRHSGRLVAVRPAVSEHPAGAAPAPTAPTEGSELRDLVTFGGDAHVLPGHQVRDVITMGGNARIEGQAFGNVVTMGGDVDVAGGRVVGDVITMGGDIRITRGGRVHGQLHAMSGRIQVDDARDGARVPVSAASAERPEAADGGHPRRWLGELLQSALKHALLFLLGLLFMGLAPSRLEAIQSKLMREPLRSLASGFLGLVAGAALTLVLTITIVGIPGAIVLALGLCWGAYLGLATTASVIGAALPVASLAGRPVLQLAVGTAILFVVSRVPVIGTLLTFFAMLAGLGAVIVTRGGARRTI
jgi:hypothetical protein